MTGLIAAWQPSHILYYIAKSIVKIFATEPPTSTLNVLAARHCNCRSPCSIDFILHNGCAKKCIYIYIDNIKNGEDDKGYRRT